MGLFGSAFSQARHGAKRTITCQTCNSNYNGNISNDFPYAICGHCLEKEGNRAQDSGNNSLYYQIRCEQERRRKAFYL